MRELFFNNKVRALIYMCAFSCLMLFCRFYLSHTFDFYFLIWNLFLAVVPIFFAHQVKTSNQKRGALHGYTLLSFFLWLMFFPNAPYIITDLIHIYHTSRKMP